MPLYDNIADALVLNTDGEPYTINVTNVGATLETNEGTALTGGYAGVWLKFDLSNFPDGTYNGNDTVHYGRNVFCELTLTKTGGDAGYLPQVDGMSVSNVAWNPASPDFNHIDYDGTVDPIYHPPFGGSYVGNGTTSAFGIFEFYGGIDAGSTVDKSKTGIWYFLVSDWSYTYHGSLTIAYQFKPLIKRYRAVDNIHPSSTTAVAVSGKVRDDYVDSVNGNLPYERYPKTLQFDTTDMKPGLYSVFVEGSWSPSANSGGVVMPFRNGLPISNINPLTFTTTFKDYVIKNHETVAQDTDPTTTPTLNYYAPHMLVLPGDDIEIVVFSGYDANKFLIEAVTFERQLKVSPGRMFDIVRFEEEPIGFANQFNWGLEPHQGGWFDSDFCVMPNGDVYVVMLESLYVGGSTPPSLFTHYFSMHKYFAATDSWSQIASGFSGWSDGNRAPQGGICVQSDGTYIYMTWWEWTGVYSNGTPDTGYIANKRFKWHFRRYNPATSTFTEFGTGQGEYANTATYTNVITDWYPPQIVLMPNGDIYVFTCENDDLSGVSGYGNHVSCYKWSGSAWAKLSMPDLNPSNYERLTTPESYVSTPIVACAGGADGDPNKIAVIYGYLVNNPSIPSGSQAWWDRNRFRYLQFNGTTWSQLDITARQLDEWWNQRDMAAPGQPYFTFYDREYNPAICFADSKIYCMINRGGPSSAVWNMYRMKADLSAWEEVQPYHPMVVNGDIIDTQPHMFTGPDNKPYIVIPNYNNQFNLVKFEEVGTGGWITAGDRGLPLYGYMYSSVTPRAKCMGNKVYICGQIRTFGDWNYLSTFVWRGTQVVDFDKGWSFGQLTFNKIVPIR